MYNGLLINRQGAILLRIAVFVLLALTLALPAAAQTAEVRRAAVAETLATAPACVGLGDAYWEIGDASGRLAWGQRGTAITAERPIHIASASKWLWGAYVVERREGKPSSDDIAALTMSSGQVGLNPLRCKGTVADCRGRGVDHAEVGRFHYDGAHAQAQAMSLDLGKLDGPGLAAEMRRLLGTDVDFTFRSPQPAGGIIMSPAAYGRFLHKLSAGQLRLAAQLGSHAVCTLPGACPTAASSPFGRNWHYSLHHWVEDAVGEDGAFSSAGAFGFYPWISADRTHWGLLARQDAAKHAGQASAACGALLRRAWLNAMPQSGDPAALPVAERRTPVRDALRQHLLERAR